MKRKQTIPGAGIRNLWTRKPITRVHDNNLKRNQKKQRQLSRKAVAKGLSELEREG